MNTDKSIQELTENYSPRIGKTWRKNRYYYNIDGKREGNKITHTGFYYSFSKNEYIKYHYVACKYVTDNECYGWHYYAGEYKTNGWREPIRISHSSKRMSNKQRRTHEKRDFYKIINEYFDK